MTSQPQSNLMIDEDRLTATYTRVFDAPRELVFQVYADPKLIPQWWGPAAYTTTVDTMDFRPGGLWRFVQRGAEGEAYAFNGSFREIVPPERVVYTFEFEGQPGHVILETVTFEALGDKTRMTAVDSFASLEDLRGMLEQGMEEGSNESFDRFAELLRLVQRAER